MELSMGRPELVSREDIIAAARDVFVKEGLRASIRDVAAVAGISEAAIFKRCSTKAALIVAAMAPPVPDLAALLSPLDGRDLRARRSRPSRGDSSAAKSGTGGAIAATINAALVEQRLKIAASEMPATAATSRIEARRPSFTKTSRAAAMMSSRLTSSGRPMLNSISKCVHTY